MRFRKRSIQSREKKELTIRKQKINRLFTRVLNSYRRMNSPNVHLLDLKEEIKKEYETVDVAYKDWGVFETLLFLDHKPAGFVFNAETFMVSNPTVWP